MSDRAKDQLKDFSDNIVENHIQFYGEEKMNDELSKLIEERSGKMLGVIDMMNAFSLGQQDMKEKAVEVCDRRISISKDAKYWANQDIRIQENEIIKSQIQKLGE